MGALVSFLGGPGVFRVILAFLVVVSHMSGLDVGRPAVFAFFVLSGYWVLRMYDQKYLPRFGIRYFYLSRFLRIWLPFAVAFVICYFMWTSGLGFSRPPEVFTGLFVFGIASTGHDVLGVSWSLDLELQFYLALPLIAYLLGVTLRPGFKPGLVWLVLGTAGLTVLGWVLQLRFGVWTFLSYLPAFLAGCLIWRSGWKTSGRAAGLSLLAFLAIGALISVFPPTRAFLHKGMENLFHLDWFGMAWVLALLPYIAWNVTQRSGWLDGHLGNYSYALYITHWPVIGAMNHLFGLPGVTGKLVNLVAVAVISVLFYVTVDRSLERVRQGVLRSKSPVQAAQ